MSLSDNFTKTEASSRLCFKGFKQKHQVEYVLTFRFSSFADKPESTRSSIPKCPFITAGEIPRELGNLNLLWHLQLSGNRLTGTCRKSCSLSTHRVVSKRSGYINCVCFVCAKLGFYNSSNHKHPRFTSQTDDVYSGIVVRVTPKFASRLNISYEVL